jgi:cell division protein ZapB
MNNENSQPSELQQLEVKLDDLIQLLSVLEIENTSLKVKQEELVREKAGLSEKNAVARSKVEAMISRLKSMEHGS